MCKVEEYVVRFLWRLLYQRVWGSSIGWKRGWEIQSENIGRFLQYNFGNRMMFSS